MAGLQAPVYEAPTYHPPVYKAPVYPSAGPAQTGSQSSSKSPSRGEEEESVLFNSATNRSLAKDLDPLPVKNDLIQLGYRYADTEEDPFVNLGNAIAKVPESERLAVYHLVYGLVATMEVMQTASEKDDYCQNFNPSQLGNLYKAVQNKAGEATPEIAKALQEVVCFMMGEE